MQEGNAGNKWLQTNHLANEAVGILVKQNVTHSPEICNIYQSNISDIVSKPPQGDTIAEPEISIGYVTDKSFNRSESQSRNENKCSDIKEHRMK